MARRFATAGAVLALVLGACGDSGQPRDPGNRVRGAIEELLRAGRDHDGRQVCSQLLAAKLVARIRDAGLDCPTVVDRAFRRVGDYRLTLVQLTVGPGVANAVVEASGGPLRTLIMVEEQGQWRFAAMREVSDVSGPPAPPRSRSRRTNTPATTPSATTPTTPTVPQAAPSPTGT